MLRSNFIANADDYANGAPVSSQHWINTANLSKDDIRWAQVELHTIGLYHGSLDGVAGSETKRALLEFQEDNGLARTATLDQPTADALVGHTGVGRVSSAQTHSDDTGMRLSLARMALADLVQTKGLGVALCSAR